MVSPSKPAKAASGAVQGIAMGLNQPPTEYSRVARMGTNTVYLDVYWDADSPQANDVHKGDHTVSDAELIGDIRQAAAAGMRVALMPKVWCNGCASGWRGALQPSDPHQFLQNYTNEVTYYANLGQQHGLWLLFLGSEMNTLDGPAYADDWRQMTDAVRQTGFTGLLTYQPNWDHDGDVTFWNVLDVVAVSAYFPLTPTPSPSLDELKAAWRSSKVSGYRGQDWFGQIQRLASSTGKPVLIGEVGYRSSTTATAHPYDEGSQQTPDQTTQANAYQALLETFTPAPWFMGVIWWQWRGTDAEAGSTDMSPKGKQAEQLLTECWAQGSCPQPAPPADASAGGPTASRAAGRTGLAATRSPATAGRSAATPATTGSTVPSTAATAGQGVINATGVAAPTVNGPRSVANLADAPSKRGPLVAIAVVVMLAMLLAIGNVVRVRVRTLRPIL
jgi:hypothetical protein